MTSVVLVAGIWQMIFGVFMFLSALFLILLVLVQRGRGGGLAGAFGGMGGQSAFGTKAGDTFTKITIVVATCWILLCMAAVKVLGPSVTAFTDSDEPLAPSPYEDMSDLEIPPAETPEGDAAIDDTLSATGGEGGE